jgi:hypothetical protein
MFLHAMTETSHYEEDIFGMFLHAMTETSEFYSFYLNRRA